MVGQYQPGTPPRSTASPFPNVGRQVVVCRVVKNGLVSGITRMVASWSASGLAYTHPSPGQTLSSSCACASVVGIGAVDAGVETVVGLVATPKALSRSTSDTNEQSVGSLPSASACDTGAAAGVVRVVAVPVVSAADGVLAPLDVHPPTPASTRPTKATMRRRIMRRG